MKAISIASPCLRGRSSAATFALLCALASACGDDGTSLAGFPDDTTLGELDDAEEHRVCEAVQARQAEDREDEAFLRGRCLEAAVDVATHRWLRDPGLSWLDDCERVFEACVEVQDEHGLTDACAAFGQCSATLGELEQCLDGTFDAYVELSARSCSELAADRGLEADDALHEHKIGACRPVVRCPELSDGMAPGFGWDGDGPYNALFDDALSNAEWVEQLDMAIMTSNRFACGETSAQREAELDDVAQAMAMDAWSTPEGAGYEADVELVWEIIHSSSLEQVRARFERALDEAPRLCLPRYGLGVAGELGEERTFVALFAAAE